MPFCSCYRRVGRLPDLDLCCFCVGTADLYYQGLRHANLGPIAAI